MPDNAIQLSVFLSPSTCRIAKGQTLKSIASNIRNHGAVLALSAVNGTEIVKFSVPGAVMRPVAQDCLGSHLRNRTVSVVASGAAAFGQLLDYRRIPVCTFDVDPEDASSFSGALISSLEMTEGEMVELINFHVAWS